LWERVIPFSPLAPLWERVRVRGFLESNFHPQPYLLPSREKEFI